MSEHWLSGYARSAAIIGVSALLFVNAAYAKIVVVDAGHGGQVRPGPYCSEDDLNLSVSNAVLYLLDGDPYTYFVATRTTDVAIAIRYRVAYADDVGADGFMSLHHNDLAQLESEAIYSNSDKQAGYWGTYSQQLAITIGNNLCFGFSQPKGYPCRGTPCTDLVCSGYTDSVLAENSRIASVGEPFGLRSTEAQKMCDAANYPDEVLEEANAYAQGLASYFDQVAVGTSFTATGGSQRITLQWVESDPGRSVAYAIYRGSSCWGPFDEYIGQVYSQDHTYTPDNMHYTYVDTTVAYSAHIGTNCESLARILRQVPYQADWLPRRPR